MDIFYLLNSPFCHQMSSRSFFIAGFKMPLCARCTAIHIGLLLGYLFHLLFMRKENQCICLLSLILFNVPLAIDGITQLYGLRESTNEIRLLTGTLSGLSFGLVIAYVIEAFNNEHKDLKLELFNTTLMKRQAHVAISSEILAYLIIYVGVLSNSLLYLIYISLYLTISSFLHNIIVPIYIMVAMIKCIKT